MHVRSMPYKLRFEHHLIPRNLIVCIYSGQRSKESSKVPICRLHVLKYLSTPRPGVTLFQRFIDACTVDAYL